MFGQPGHRVEVVGPFGERRGLRAPETGAAAVGDALRDDALQLLVVVGEPGPDLGKIAVVGAGQQAERCRKLLLLDGDGASQVEKRPSGHGQQGPRAEVVVVELGVHRGHREPEPETFGQKEPRNTAATQSGVGPDVVGEPGELLGRLAAGKNGDRLPMPSEERGCAGVTAPESAPGVVAAGGDDGVDRRTAVVEFDGDVGVDRAQQLNRMTDQHAVLGRRFHQAAVAACDDAQKVEEPHQRNVAGHDDQHAARCGDGNRIAGQPGFERIAPEHPVGDSGDGPADLVRREPLVRTACFADNALRLSIVAEVAEPVAQGIEKIDGLHHDNKDNVSHRNMRTIAPFLLSECENMRPWKNDAKRFSNAAAATTD